MKSVCNVHTGTEKHGFTEKRSAALWSRWRAVTRQSRSHLLTQALDALDPLTAMFFLQVAMDALSALSTLILCILTVVQGRKESRLQAWTYWIREDLGSHPREWLRPDFVPPAPYLVCTPAESPNEIPVADLSRLRQQDAVTNARRALLLARRRWYPVIF